MDGSTVPEADPAIPAIERWDFLVATEEEQNDGTDGNHSPVNLVLQESGGRKTICNTAFQSTLTPERLTFSCGLPVTPTSESVSLWNMDLEESFASYIAGGTQTGDSDAMNSFGQIESTNPVVPLSLSAVPTRSEIPKKSIKPKQMRRERMKKRPYTEQFLQSLLTNVRNGTMTMYHAEKFHGVPRATLQYRLGNGFKNKGRTGPDTVLTSDEERKIVNWLQDMERRGFPITRSGLIIKVSSYLKCVQRKNPCRNNIPGRRWLEGFLRRHPQLTLRTPEAVTSASARVSEQDIRKWFETVEDYLNKNNLAGALKNPSRILNGDETGFCMNSTPRKVLATKGVKNVPLVETQNGKQNVTVLFSFAADGTIVPPDVILPYKRLSREIVQSFPSDWGLGTSESGWMDSTNFTLYIKKVLYPSLVKRGVEFPVIYFVDGHKSHTAFEAADACSKLGIVLIALYPNATRIIQPADVSIFRPLKNSWGKVMEIWKTDNMAERLSIPTCGSLLQETMKSSFKTSTIINAFRACGLSPYNPNAVDYSKCIANHQSQPEPTSPDSSMNETRTTPENDIVDDQHIMTLIPAAAIESAIKMIGDDKILLYESGDYDTFSNEDKTLSFIYKNILSVGQFNNDITTTYEENVTGNQDETEYMQNLDAAVAEPMIILDEGTTLDELETDTQQNYLSDWEKQDDYRIEAPPNDFEQTSVLADISNMPETSKLRSSSFSKFFDTPPTPKRNPKHRFYKQKSYAILTAGERLAELRQMELDKLEAIKLKEEKAELRKRNKIEKEVEAERLKEEKAILRKRKITEKETATKKLKKEKSEKRQRDKVEKEARTAAKGNTKKLKETEREKKQKDLRLL